VVTTANGIATNACNSIGVVGESECDKVGLISERRF